MSAMTSGRVSVNRSLLPLRSRAWDAKRTPRKSCSSRPRAWIMVPMAPSSNRMRSESSRSSVVRQSMRSSGTGGPGCLTRRGGAYTQEAADGPGQFGPVEGIEMEIAHPFLLQHAALLARHVGGYEFARLGILIQAIEETG